MKKIYFHLLLTLLCGGCSVHHGDFGAKLCAAHENYDSGSYHLRRYIKKEKEVPGIYLTFLGIAEMHRGNIPEMHEAFEKAASKEKLPEPLLLRCQWYIESGNAEKAETELAAAKNLLAARDVSKNYTYYLFLIIREHFALSSSHKQYRQFLQQALEMLEVQLAQLKRTQGKGLFVLRKFRDTAFEKITYGMTECELRQHLGAPCKVVLINEGMKKRRLLIYHKNGLLAGFFFTKESHLLGKVKAADCCKKHGVLQMRLLKRGRTLAGKVIKPFYNEDFYYTAAYKSAADFEWVCLKCKKSGENSHGR